MDPWQRLHDHGFSWDDVNALVAILEAEPDLRAALATPPEPSPTADAAWEAHAADVHNGICQCGDYRRPVIEAAIRPTLDVERLKRAMSNHEDEDGPSAFPDQPHMCDFGCATDIAAHYARLASETDHDPR